MTDIQLRIRVDDADDRAAAEALAEATDVELQLAPAVPTEDAEVQIAPIAAVLIGAGVLAAGTFVNSWWAGRAEAKRGGLVIDQRPDATDAIYRDQNLPYGYVVIYPSDGGQVKVEVKDAPKDAVERWISEVISGAYKTVTELAKLVADKPAGDNIKVAPG